MKLTARQAAQRYKGGEPVYWVHLDSSPVTYTESWPFDFEIEKHTLETAFVFVQSAIEDGAGAPYSTEESARAAVEEINGEPIEDEEP